MIYVDWPLCLGNDHRWDDYQGLLMPLCNQSHSASLILNRALSIQNSHEDKFYPKKKTSMMNSSCKVISSYSLTIQVLPFLQKSTAQATAILYSFENISPSSQSPQRLIAIKRFVSFFIRSKQCHSDEQNTSSRAHLSFRAWWSGWADSDVREIETKWRVEGREVSDSVSSLRTAEFLRLESCFVTAYIWVDMWQEANVLSNSVHAVGIEGMPHWTLWRV